jgi:hypothetical protein
VMLLLAVGRRSVLHGMKMAVCCSRMVQHTTESGVGTQQCCTSAVMPVSSPVVRLQQSCSLCGSLCWTAASLVVSRRV